MEEDTMGLSQSEATEQPVEDSHPADIGMMADTSPQAMESVLAQMEAESEAQHPPLGGADQGERVSEREAQVAQLRQALSEAAAKYRLLLLASAPEVPQELVTGNTIEELDASMATAQSVVAQVRQNLESHRDRERVPAGSPARGTPDLAGLSPRDKIAYALSRGQR